MAESVTIDNEYEPHGLSMSAEFIPRSRKTRWKSALTWRLTVYHLGEPVCTDTWHEGPDWLGLDDDARRLSRGERQAWLESCETGRWEGEPIAAPTLRLCLPVLLDAHVELPKTLIARLGQGGYDRLAAD